MSTFRAHIKLAAILKYRTNIKRHYNKLKNSMNIEEKNNELQASEGDARQTNDNYKSAIDYISGINNKANILSSQANYLPKGILGSSFSSSLSDIIRQYSKMNTLYSGLPDIIHMVQKSPALIAARDANLSISRLVSSNSILEMSKAMQASKSMLSTSNSLAALSNPLSSFLQRESNIAKLASYPSIDKSLTYLFAASSNIGRIAEYSLQAEKNFAAFNLANLGSRIGINNKYKPLLSDTIMRYSKSFSDLWKSYEVTPKVFIDLSPTLLRIPPIEYYNTSSLIEKISINEYDDAEKELLTGDLLIENEETLTTLLPKLNPDLLNIWLGAKQTLESDNVERVRHFTTSIRELVTQVLHSLSPDQDVVKWTPNPIEHIQNGKPTRKARLLYIYRDVNNDYFKSFIEADIKATLQFIDLFQEGTHSVKSKLTEKQLLTIKIKTESTLKYLLQTFYETK